MTTSRCSSVVDPFDPLPQIFPLDIVHDQILALTFNRKIIAHPRQVWVPQAGEDIGFMSKLPGIFFA
jgi:hypothetical protein